MVFQISRGRQRCCNPNPLKDWFEVVSVSPRYLVVCVAKGTKAAEMEIYANVVRPCGTSKGWKVTQFNQECVRNPRRIHIVLEA